MGRKLTQDEIVKLYQIFWYQIDIDRKPPVWALLTEQERHRIYQAFDQSVTLDDPTLEQDGWEQVEPGNVQFKPGDMIRAVLDYRDSDYRHYQFRQDAVTFQKENSVFTEIGYIFYIGDDIDDREQIYVKRKPVNHPNPDEHPVIKVLDADWPDDIEDNEKPVVYVANREERYYEGFLNETHEHTDILDPYEITCWEVPTGWEERQ
ncbi:hypothetical protein [Auritidibacter sp. NML100628]|uniref:hypothetical protein n=1 Tax=Auritidibacter sp. NML100628 TaxID=2170742 RepID=UPI000D732BB0|nr:hypothetical protein [Auritidibacter sp. NML100628]PXA77912.1 hypothetical protein DCC24_03190 [Auritidibacter sp. NML100628]